MAHLEKGGTPGASMEAFVRGFIRDAGHSEKNLEIQPIPGDGSRRVFWRVRASEPEATYVAMENCPEDPGADRENRAYVRIGRHLLEKGLPLPEIYLFDLSTGRFVMEDLGNRSLQDAARLGDPLPLYEGVLEVLLRLQMEGCKGFDPTWTCQTERYDRFVMRRYESEYFREAFLWRYLGLKADWPELAGPFDFLAEKASLAPNHFLIHRDFQSRNIMVSEKGAGLVDWQGARLGPLAYDVASLLIDPYTDLSEPQRSTIYRMYVNRLATCHPAWVETFEESFPYLALQRNLQILGAFSYLSKVRGKRHFEVYIPKALRCLHGLLAKAGVGELSPLLDLAGDLLRERLQRQEGMGPT